MMRADLEFKSTIESDWAPDVVSELIRAGIEIHRLRDPTRGDLTNALNEIAEASNFANTGGRGQRPIPARSDVAASEGRFAAFVPEREADRAVHPASRISAKPSGEEMRMAPDLLSAEMIAIGNCRMTLYIRPNSSAQKDDRGPQ